MKSKTILGSVLALVLIFTLAGCGSSGGGENSNGKPIITIWAYSEKSDWGIDFDKKFPDLKINYVTLPSGEEYKQKLQTTMVGNGDLPDIVQMDSWVTEMYQFKDEFANLNDYGADKVKDKYLDWKWEDGTVTGSNYMIGFPIDVGPIGLYYRADMFKKAGLPSKPEDVKKKLKTWDDYYHAQRELHKMNGSTTTSARELFNKEMQQEKRGYFDKNNKFIGDQKFVKDNWDMAVKFAQNGLTSNEEPSAEFDHGDISTEVHAAWAQDDLKDDAPSTKGKWRVAFPPGGGGNRGGSFWGVMKESSHPQQAFDVIKKMASPDSQKEMYKEKGDIPSTPEVYDDPKLNEKDDFFGGQKAAKIFTDSAKDIDPSPSSPKDSVPQDAFAEQLDQVETEHKNAEKAWKDAIKKIKTELSR